MEKTKLLTFAVIGLMLLNIGLLTYLWLMPPANRPPQGGKGDQSRALEFLMTELKFDPNQRFAANQLLQNHRRRMDSLQNINRQNRNNLYDHLETGDTTAAAAIGDTQKKVELEAFSYFRSIRSLCHDQQKTEFDRVIYDAMRMTAPPQPPRN